MKVYIRLLAAGVMVLWVVVPARAEYVELRTWVQGSSEVSNGFRFAAADLHGEPVGSIAELSNAQAAAEATFGLSRVHAWARTDSSSPDGAFATSRAEWLDEMTITPGDASLSGQPGQLSVDMAFEGSGDVSSGNGSASYEFYLNLNGSGFGPAGGQWNPSFSGFPPMTITNYGFAFTFGQPFAVRCYTKVTASTGSGGETEATVDFARSPQSLAIVSMTAPSGEVTNYTISSASGRSWTEPYLSPPVEISALSSSSGQVALTVDHLSIGFTNLLESSSDVAATNWDSVATLPVMAGTTSVTANVSGSNARFFRVQQK